MTTVLVSAGDASGDLHAGALMQALRQRVPDLRVIGIGGAELEKAGAELTVHQRELAIGGLVEVLASLRRIVGAWRRLSRALVGERPDLVVLVDSPDFNIPFARRVRRRGIPILYYVSPQVWAWRRWRIGKIARRVDRMAVIFPFEPDVYAGTSLPVDFVGHPLVERLSPCSAADRAAARGALGLDAERPLVLLLPGSRRNELRYNLPLYVDVARKLHARDPRLAFVLALAPTLDCAEVQARLAEVGLPALLRLDVIQGHTHAAMRAADVALAMPGTATVELALLGTPTAVVGVANPVSVFVARRLGSVSQYAMPNLIAGRPVMPEFVQEDADPERIAEAVRALLGGVARDAQQADLREVRRLLGEGGAAGRASAIAAEMIDGSVGA
ncbi:MAG: lipid-A-disaccharide synthase [Deltaproteobacteria bacterium]|nr:lipid-A-disaccharide synthase [Deltaproteobacteria bacterium]MBW2371099.1 lipid-A-disaccharide synthase [Deltaproteobacteria bacterium]